MTRDEAARIYWETKSHSGRQIPGWAYDIIDGFVALGMLKLDEPKIKSPISLFLDELIYTPLQPEFPKIMDAITRAGLKLVLK
jgi:hypothetical protein